MISVVKAEYLQGYRILLDFSDGKSGVVDLQNNVYTFKPFFVLQDTGVFSKFTVDYTIRWSDELDIAPEYLYFKAFEDDRELDGIFREWGYVS
mgnify:FL=1